MRPGSFWRALLAGLRDFAFDFFFACVIMRFSKAE
jgi:hypothetical protein